MYVHKKENIKIMQIEINLINSEKTSYMTLLIYIYTFFFKPYYKEISIA